jgi:hypothetical protein
MSQDFKSIFGKSACFIKHENLDSSTNIDSTWLNAENAGFSQPFERKSHTTSQHCRQRGRDCRRQEISRPKHDVRSAETILDELWDGDDVSYQRETTHGTNEVVAVPHELGLNFLWVEDVPDHVSLGCLEASSNHDSSRVLGGLEHLGSSKKCVFLVDIVYWVVNCTRIGIQGRFSNRYTLSC